MITNTMTPVEIDKELLKDWLEINREDKRFRALGGWKQARSAKAKFPMSIIHEYVSSRNNRYLLQDVIASREEAMLGLGALYIRALWDNGDGYYVCMQNYGERDYTRTLFILSPHLFSRYRERMHLKQDGIDIIRYFLKRNRIFVHNEDYRRGKDNTEDVMVSCCDGALFGKYFQDGEIMVMDMRTFVANETLTDGYKGRFYNDYENSIKESITKASYDPMTAHVMAHGLTHRKPTKTKED